MTPLKFTASTKRLSNLIKSHMMFHTGVQKNLMAILVPIRYRQGYFLRTYMDGNDLSSTMALNYDYLDSLPVLGVVKCVHEKLECQKYTGIQFFLLHTSIMQILVSIIVFNTS